MSENHKLSLRQKLLAIQSELKAPKGQTNKFGNYQYRSAEDILQGLKPLLVKYGVTILCNDTIVERGVHLFNVTTVTLLDVSFKVCDATIMQEKQLSTEHWAMHGLSKKGMDPAQLSGATASYALKRALGNMFAIDNEKDADSTNDHGQSERPKDVAMAIQQAIKDIESCTSMESLQELWAKIPKHITSNPAVIESKDNKKQYIKNDI